MKPIDNAIAVMADELTAWRRHLHENPELGYEEFETQKFVAGKLREFGMDVVHEGMGGTGVVAMLHGADGPATGPEGRIMLRSDMDALPMDELTGLPHASKNAGKMHACGHDGHMTMLLGAAKHLADKRNFSGSVVFCFQPAEEGGAGAKKMIEDGIFEQFDVRAVYGMHSLPGAAIGEIAAVPGPVMAAADEFYITVTGKGGHAAVPDEARDPIPAAALMVSAFQSIVSRVVDPLKPAVLSITIFQAGTTHNVIPETVTLGGTVRSFDTGVHEQIYAEIEKVIAGIAAATGMKAELDRVDICYPPTINDATETKFVQDVLCEVVGHENVITNAPPTMGAEDFAYFSQAKPGAFVFIGNGASEPLHHPAYDFDDAAAPIGVAYWTKLVETALKRKG
ncbi:MAG: M20 aminoacylase family protein [Pikeienuella sp.]